MKVLLVVNSFASSVTARNTVVVHRRLSRNHDVQVVETNRRGHATRFAHDAARRGVDVVIGFGGDGTLNEVATGIAGSDTALGVLPGGSTNVFARTIGMPNDPVAAVELLAGGIDAADLRPIGLGRVNGRFFCFHTGVGFDAAVVQRVEKRGSLETVARPPVVHQRRDHHLAHRLRPPHPAFPSVGRRRPGVDDGYFSIVLNTNPYTYLGNRPLDLSPAATLDQPLVAITFTTMSATAILSSLAGAFRGGGVKPAKHLDVRVGVRHLVIEHDTPFPYQVDGDALGDTRRLEFDYVPDAVKLVFPDSRNGNRRRRARRHRTTTESPGVGPVTRGDRPPTEREAGDRRHVGAHAVDPERFEFDEPFGIVGGPDVHEQTGRMTALDERFGDEPFPRVHRGVAGRGHPFDPLVVERHAQDTPSPTSPA